MEYKDTKFVYIMGVLGDKDYTEVIKLMVDRAEYIITVTPPNPRALEAIKLKEAIDEYNPNVQWTTSIEEAYDIAMDKLNELCGKLDKNSDKHSDKHSHRDLDKDSEESDDSAILAFGSLSYLGRFREVCKERGIC